MISQDRGYGDDADDGADANDDDQQAQDDDLDQPPSLVYDTDEDQDEQVANDDDEKSNHEVEQIGSRGDVAEELNTESDIDDESAKSLSDDESKMRESIEESQAKQPIQCQEATQAEMTSLRVLEEVPTEVDAGQAVTIFKAKRDVSGRVQHNKARLMSQQSHSLFDVPSPQATTTRLSLAFFVVFVLSIALLGLQTDCLHTRMGFGIGNVSWLSNGYVLSPEPWTIDVAERSHHPSASTVVTPSVFRAQPSGKDEPQADCTLSHASKKIAIVTSSTEAELYAVHVAVEEAQYVHQVLYSLGIPFPFPLRIHEDNQAIACVGDNLLPRLKEHEDFLRQQVQRGNTSFGHITRAQLSVLRVQLGTDPP